MISGNEGGSGVLWNRGGRGVRFRLRWLGPVVDAAGDEGRDHSVLKDGVVMAPIRFSSCESSRSRRSGGVV